MNDKEKKSVKSEENKNQSAKEVDYDEDYVCSPEFPHGCEPNLEKLED